MVSLPIINKQNSNVKDLGKNGGQKKKYSATGAIRHPVTSNKIYGPIVFLLTKINPEYSDILYNPSHFPGPLVCRIRQVPLYIDASEMYVDGKKDLR